MIVVHYPGTLATDGEFTPCGTRYLAPAPGTFHTVACLAGQATCIGIHVTAVVASNSPSIVNCPGCIEKVMEATGE